MTNFENVTVVRKANVYFNGGVTSRTILFPTGEKKTLGIVLPGEYTFNTSQNERIEIQSGEAEVLLPNSSQPKKISAGQSFDVPANSSFTIKALSLTDYCCSYFDFE